MIQYRFLEPLDVLFLRGNKLFGDPGSYGAALIPPWPSVAAGALRSRMLVDDGLDPSAFRDSDTPHPALGTYADPGPFTVTGFHLARRQGTKAQTLHPLPADLLATREADELRLHRLVPTTPGPGVDSSAVLPRVPVFANDRQAKPVAGCWLTQAGWGRYLAGDLPDARDLVASGDLWQLDHRIGVGLDRASRRAADGQLFSTQAVALNPGHGFLVAVDGAEPPTTGSLRLGGDGRAAMLHAVDYDPIEADLERIAAQRRCRLILTGPGLFDGGWRPTGADAEDRFRLGGVSGRLVCAAVPRAEVVSGWDLASNRPKPAQRVAPTGSVYWLDELEADAEALRRLVARGLWDEEGFDAGRRAEGFNRAVVASWSEA